jgi:hypothetical protein
MIRGCHHLCKYTSSPEESRRFISADPQKDLQMDPELKIPMRLAVTPGPSPLLSNLSQLAGLGAGQVTSDSALLMQQLQQLQQAQQRQQLSGLGPLLQLLSGGGTADASVPNLQLGSLQSQLLGGGSRRASLPSSLSLNNGEGQNRSAIAAFLANSSHLGGDNVLRDTGSGINMRKP